MVNNMPNIIEFMNESVLDTDVLSVQLVAATPLDDGYVGKLNGLVTGERDLYNILPPAAVTTDNLVIICGAENYIDSLGYRNPIHDKTKWTYAGDRPVRAYRPRVGMRFKINTSAISGTPVAGQYLIPANSTFQLAAAADLSGNTKLAFEVEETGSTCNIFVGKTNVAATIMRVIKV
jgi:hypothetical protein